MTSALRMKTYMPSRFGTKGLLRIGPNISITCKFDPQFGQRLPNQQHHAILRSVEVHPHHRLDIVSNGWSGQETVDDCSELYMSAESKGICRNEMYVFQLFPSAMRSSLLFLG